MRNLKILVFGVILIIANTSYSQLLMSYEEFHERYTPTNEKLIPNSSVVKEINTMDPITIPS